MSITESNPAPTRILSEDEFDARFTVIPDADGDQVRSSMPGTDPASRNLWTIVEGDNGSLYADPGIRYVNRVGYLLTEEEWTDDIETSEWFVNDFEEDEEDEEDED